MRKFVLLILVLLLISCSVTRNGLVWEKSVTNLLSIYKICTQDQFNDICEKEKIPNDLYYWTPEEYKLDQDGIPITRYKFWKIKYNNMSDTEFVMIPRLDGKYNIEKTVTDYKYFMKKKN